MMYSSKRFDNQSSLILVRFLSPTMQDVAEHGLPPMRPLLVQFPRDSVCETIEDQFMFGAEIMVAPAPEEGRGDGGCPFWQVATESMPEPARVSMAANELRWQHPWRQCPRALQTQNCRKQASVRAEHLLEPEPIALA